MCSEAHLRVGSLRRALRGPRRSHRGRKSGSCGAAASTRIVRSRSGGPGLGSGFRYRWVLVVCVQLRVLPCYRSSLLTLRFTLSIPISHSQHLY
jgi:hypothetical protein